jgi:hypothetical protein
MSELKPNDLFGEWVDKNDAPAIAAEKAVIKKEERGDTARKKEKEINFIFSRRSIRELERSIKEVAAITPRGGDRRKKANNETERP